MLNPDDSRPGNLETASPGDVTAIPDAGEPIPDALVAALAEIERHVGAGGWDQPARLFALVRTADLVRAEPALADELAGSAPDALTAIEQDDVLTDPGVTPTADDIVAELEGMEWSPAVAGVALALQRGFLPAGVHVELPDDPARAAAMVDAHPARQDMRVVVGVLRDGATHGLARLRERPDELLGGPQLAPGLAEVLKGTLE